jgi:hypothetical protein
MMGIGQLLPKRVHHVRILPHHQIQKNPLRSEKALHPLLRPTRQERNK